VSGVWLAKKGSSVTGTFQTHPPFRPRF
jgi:hypothetical protein